MATVIGILSTTAAWSAGPDFQVTASKVGPDNDWVYTFLNKSADCSVASLNFYWEGAIGVTPADVAKASANFYDGLKPDYTIDWSNPKYGYKIVGSCPKPWEKDYYSYSSHPGFTSTDSVGNPVSPILPGAQKTFKVHYFGAEQTHLFSALYVRTGNVGLQRTFGTQVTEMTEAPEPGTVLALLSGLGGLAAFKLRGKS